MVLLCNLHGYSGVYYKNLSSLTFENLVYWDLIAFVLVCLASQLIVFGTW